MATIQITPINPTTFDVRINDRTPTQHTVTVQAGDIEKLAAGTSIETLIEKSFEFLLEREPNTSILRSFDLSVIRNYFPEYDRVIKSMIQST